jgi:hypothetical protein
MHRLDRKYRKGTVMHRLDRKYRKGTVMSAHLETQLAIGARHESWSQLNVRRDSEYNGVLHRQQGINNMDIFNY